MRSKKTQVARSAFVRSGPTFALVSLLVIGLGINTGAVRAVEMPSLYTVEVPYDRDDSNAQAKAYRAAMTEVLARITGTAGVAESSELMALFPDLERFVRQIRPGPRSADDEDTLIVSFNGASIEQLLRQSGATVWGSDRRLTLVWLAVDWGRGGRQIIASDDQTRDSSTNRSIDRNSQLRERVLDVAERRGVPVLFPLLDAEDRENIEFSDIWGGFDEPLLAAAERYGATSVLVGRVRPDNRRANRWTWYVGGQRMGWDGSPEEATNLLADSLAAMDAIPGGQVGESMQLTISGISSVRAYGEVQHYLDGLQILDSCTINNVVADKIIYDVDVRGGLTRLRSALELARFLEQVETSSGIDANRLGLSDATRDNATAIPFNTQVLHYAYRQPEALRQPRDRVRDPRQEPIPNTRQNTGQD